MRDPDVSLGPFDETYDRSMQARGVCQVFLRHPPLLSQLAETVPERDKVLLRGDPPVVLHDLATVCSGSAAIDYGSVAS